MSLNQRPAVLLGATTWWPLSARLAMAFLRHGCRVSAICPPGHPLSYVSGIEAIYTYRGLSSLQSLRAAILKSQPDLIVPCDDGVVWQLHELHATHPDLRSRIETSLGPASFYPQIRGRDAFLQAAVALGIRVPTTRTITSEHDLAAHNWETPAVLKLDGTWGGSGVIIVKTEAEARAAFRKLSKPNGPGLVWKRWLVNRDPLALWSGHGRERPTVSIQQFIPGQPANAMIACWQGEMLGIVTVAVLAAQGATGAATVVKLVQSDEIHQAATQLASHFQLTGFYGLDFMLENGTGAPYLIELNPRCTQLGHLRLPAQGDLAGMISARLGGSAEPSADTGFEDCASDSTVAFFPQTLTWNPNSRYLKTGLHDVPWEEPALFRELLHRPWPERQLLNRIYHFFRAQKKPGEVRF